MKSKHQSTSAETLVLSLTSGSLKSPGTVTRRWVTRPLRPSSLPHTFRLWNNVETPQWGGICFDTCTVGSFLPVFPTTGDRVLGIENLRRKLSIT